MTTKGMEEGAEDFRLQRVESEGRTAKPERLAAWEVDAASEARQPLEWTPGPRTQGGRGNQRGRDVKSAGEGMNWYRIMLLMTAVVLGLGVNAWAGVPTDQVRAYTDQVLKVLENPALTLPQRREAVRSLASEAFDTTETAQRALGVHWQQRTPLEREQFVKLFANLLEQTYISRIDEYGGEHLEYVGEQVDGDKATVRARIITSKGSVVAVESRVIQKGGRWLIYDILIENLSLISNYRSQFDRVIRTSSYGELVKRLQARVDALNEKDKIPRGTAQAPR